MVSPNISNIFGNLLPTFSTTFALLTTNPQRDGSIADKFSRAAVLFWLVLCVPYRARRRRRGGRKPVSDARQGSAGFHIKRAPLAWKLGKTRFSGRPVEGVIELESFPVQSTGGIHSQGPVAIAGSNKKGKPGKQEVPG